MAISDETRKKISLNRKFKATGSDHGQSVLNEDKVLVMVVLYTYGFASQSKLGVLFGVSESAVAKVLSGETWGHITGISKDQGGCKPYNGQVKAVGENSGRSVLTNDAVLDIVELYNSGYGSYRVLASQFGVSPSTIKAIIRGETWSHITGIEQVKRKRNAKRIGDHNAEFGRL